VHILRIVSGEESGDGSKLLLTVLGEENEES
jgi:hypothetical protein